MKRIITTLSFAIALTMAWAQNELPTFTSLPEYSGRVISKNGISIKRMKDKTLVYIVNTCATNSEEYKIGGMENRTFLVDGNTGTHYQARGIVDNVVPWGKQFCVKGMRGKRWAVVVEFPPLPKSVKTFYFVHLWNNINLKKYVSNEVEEFDGQRITYDTSLPKIPKRKVIQDASYYNKHDKYTFPIYGDEWAIAPINATENSVNTFAIWCTKECTILARTNRLGWDKHYFQNPSESYIVDSMTGEKYKVKGQYDGAPLDVSYNIQGVSGEWVCSFEIYPPLPETCTVIDIVEGAVNDNVQNGTCWSCATNLRNVPVARLQANQNIMKFQKTKIVK